MARAAETRKCRIRRAFGVLLVALGLIACQPEGAEPPPPEPLRMSMLLWPGYFPALVADERGFAEARGLDLDVVVAQDITELLADFAAGRHDLIAVPLANALMLAQQRPDTVIVLVTNESLGGDVLLRAKDFNVAGDGPVRLGTHLGGFGELLVREYLVRHGVAPSRWVWVDTPSADVPEALARDRIDIGHTWEPHLGAALAAGAEPVFTSAETPGLVLDVAVTTRSLLERRPEDVQRFLAAWFDAIADWTAHPEAVRNVLARRLAVPPEAISLDGVRLFSREDNRRAFMPLAEDGDALLTDTIGLYSSYFLERGTLSRPADVDTLMGGDRLYGAPTAGSP